MRQTIADVDDGRRRSAAEVGTSLKPPDRCGDRTMPGSSRDVLCVLLRSGRTSRSVLYDQLTESTAQTGANPARVTSSQTMDRPYERSRPSLSSKRSDCQSIAPVSGSRNAVSTSSPVSSGVQTWHQQRHPSNGGPLRVMFRSRPVTKSRTDQMSVPTKSGDSRAPWPSRLRYATTRKQADLPSACFSVGGGSVGRRSVAGRWSGVRNPTASSRVA